MSDIVIHEATVDDVPLIRRFLRAMLEEMGMMGGRPLVEDPSVWARFEASIGVEVGKDDHIYFLATLQDSETNPVGLAEARILPAMPIFQLDRVLHIHALYVRDRHRRKGIGRVLLNRILIWGRDKGCQEAELNTLAANPARSLYEGFGFSLSEVKMTRRL
jgi:GNAT superfamily N-acetyltransferase